MQVRSARGGFCSEIRSRLARDAKGGPRDGGETLAADRLIAADADSKSARVDSGNRVAYIAELAGVTLQIADHVIVIASLLDAVQIVRTGLNG